MRAVVAMLKHETNTFSPVATPLARFGPQGPAWGKAARKAYEGTATPTGAFLALAGEAGMTVATPVAAEAWPSGPASAATFEQLAAPIVEEVARGCDVVLLDLHGAMVVEGEPDAEGALLAAVRATAPGVPVGVALDLHANVTRRMVENATAIAGFKTYPHVDMYETGLAVGRIAIAAAEGKVRPAMAWGSRPMLPHIMRQATDDEPMAGLVEAARQAERRGALAVSVFGGFPHADIPDAGLSVVAVTADDRGAAEGIANRLLDEAWERRSRFVYWGEPAASAVARAGRMGQGPVILLDHCDNCGSGGTQDVMTVVGEILAQGLEDVVIFAIHDPWAVAEMARAGVGAEVTLPLGGKLAMPSIGLAARPLEVTGRVRLLSDGAFTIRGPMYTGVRAAMGRTAVLDTGKAEIVVIERHHEPWDVGCLTSLGIDPSARRYVMLKSRVHWRAGFKGLARAVVECAGDGVTTSDYGRLAFTSLRRPIFPLDDL